MKNINLVTLNAQNIFFEKIVKMLGLVKVSVVKEFIMIHSTHVERISGQIRITVKVCIDSGWFLKIYQAVVPLDV